MPRRRYILTARAAVDLREARAWSRTRWGKALTDRYFDDLHHGAQYIAENLESLRGRHDLAGGTALLLYPVREHHIVYEPLSARYIAVVIRQGRDVAAILQKWATPIRRDLVDIRARINRGEVVLPKQRAATSSQRKSPSRRK